jgi:hypothetical protein
VSIDFSFGHASTHHKSQWHKRLFVRILPAASITLLTKSFNWSLNWESLTNWQCCQLSMWATFSHEISIEEELELRIQSEVQEQAAKFCHHSTLCCTHCHFTEGLPLWTLEPSVESNRAGYLWPPWAGHLRVRTGAVHVMIWQIENPGCIDFAHTVFEMRRVTPDIDSVILFWSLLNSWSCYKFLNLRVSIRIWY